MKQHHVKPRAFYTSTAVAAFCQVDIKTIHNWANHGEIEHRRTPGQHLRFRPTDIVDFLRKYEYPVPPELLAGKPRVYILDAASAKLAAVKRTLSAEFDVTSFDEPIDLLVAIGSRPPTAVVLDVNLASFDGLHFLARLVLLPATRHIRAVVFSAEERMRAKALEAGAAAFVAKPDVQMLRAALETPPAPRERRSVPPERLPGLRH